MIVPTSYCYDILKLIEEGYQALNTKRFVFYLSEEDTKRVQTSLESINSSVPLYIVQNLEAGGSMAITKEAYFDIGGMDEDFVGWGGEDNEFWRRCSHLKRWIWGFTPIIHLWHESQPLKRNTKNENVERARMLENVTIEDRIRELRERNQFIIENKGLI
jgi:GT2 family glycosyltransferase